MCGIVGYVGRKAALPILIEGLKRLEYRGYDSAGVAVVDNGEIQISRKVGHVSELEREVAEAEVDGRIGIGHTRWATHGSPTELNAHPHLDQAGLFAVVHNGIIENHTALRTYLAQEGIECASETDTEVLVQLIGKFYDGDLELAVRSALAEIRGTYGIALVCRDQPDKLIVARSGSPLIIGVGDGEYIVGSDAAAIVAHTSHVIYLSDNEMAVLTDDSLRTTTIDNVPVTKQISELEISLEEIERGEHDHFMIKEIFEQPEALETCLRGRLDLRDGQIHLGGLESFAREMARCRRVILTGCGTAWHAGLIGAYLFEELARVPANAEYASELRYRNPVIEEGTVLIALSQSGETADTLAAVREVRDRGALVVGIVNVVGSTVARETDAGVYLHVGPEIGVASTKAFSGQILVLAMMAAWLGRRRHLSADALDRFVRALAEAPNLVAETLKLSDQVARIAAEFVDQENWLYLGRGCQFPVALEGALKLKEISYIHSEGMPAAEMKHGPIALVTDGMPAVFMATVDSHYEKVLGNIEEIRSRGGRVIAITTEGDSSIHDLCEHVLLVPKTEPSLQPILTVIPLQLLAYHAAVLRGCNVDRPRNLAKSVTVE
jgi:glucosamine--fructose-6-phosphate aminotransferase (isomerizing)